MSSQSLYFRLDSFLPFGWALEDASFANASIRSGRGSRVGTEKWQALEGDKYER